MDKWGRGFHRVINVQGADHHGTVDSGAGGSAGARVFRPGYPEYVLHQMVRSSRTGEEVKFSKRPAPG